MTRPMTSPVDGRVADINRRVLHAHDTVREVHSQTEEMHTQMEDLQGQLGEYASILSESNAYVGVEMRRLEESLEATRASLAARMEALEDRGYVERLDQASRAPLEELDGAVANLVNLAGGHRGFAAEADLWFNPPTTVELGERSARLASVNERIVELPFAFGALARIQPPARILDIGGAESTFSLSAASLGYQVTCVDLRELPYRHPNLNSFAGKFELWDPRETRFQAAFLISTIEHFGLGAYGEAKGEIDADRTAVARIAELLDDDGFLVITAPYGEAGISEFERIYDDGGLEQLLEGWTLIERQLIYRQDDLTWSPVESRESTAGVAMIVATPNR